MLSPRTEEAIANKEEMGYRDPKSTNGNRRASMDLIRCLEQPLKQAEETKHDRKEATSFPL